MGPSIVVAVAVVVAVVVSMAVCLLGGHPAQPARRGPASLCRCDQSEVLDRSICPLPLAAARLQRTDAKLPERRRCACASELLRVRAPSLRAQREDSRLQLRACNRAAPAYKMPKKRKAPPPPAYTGELLPVGHVVDGGWWATTFKVTRRLDGDPAASEVVLAVDEKTGEDAVIKCELLNAASTQVYHDRNVLDWLLRGRGQRECPLEPNWAPPQRGRVVCFLFTI